ncbi:Unknown protein [Striga hermonthica]|uniref:Uncharacterized protein n=1 Tax=Striga hermonthica TaxID=68872 RepID=A0A9N7NHR7_STRHE|nr:Unknown protein [Striga hermonthica]
MAQNIVFNHVGGKPPFFDGISSFDHWKRKMKTHLGSIHAKVWDVTEREYIILDEKNMTPNEQANKQCNTMALNTIYKGIDAKVFEQIKDLEKASDLWTRLEETYEGTTTVKSAKLYMLKKQLTNFKMKDDENIPEMFHRLQVIINDLKSLGEKVSDEDFSQKFLWCLPKRFKTLITIIFRGGLKNVTPNEVLGDVMTEDRYEEDSDNEDKKDNEKKKEKKDKDKVVAFKATSSKSKGKAKKKLSSDESTSDSDDDDDEAMALLVRKFGKFMKKKGYSTRKRRDKFKSKGHSKKKDKKEKKRGTKVYMKKKGSSHVATWESEASTSSSSDDEDDRRSKKKGHASIARGNTTSLFASSSPACFMAKGPKVQSHDSDSESSSSDSDSEEPSKLELLDALDQAQTIIKHKGKKCKELSKEVKSLRQSHSELEASHECLKEDHEDLTLAHTKLEKAHSLVLEELERPKDAHAKLVKSHASLEAISEQVIVSCDVGVTCDILDEKFFEPIIVTPTNASSSSTTSTSTNSATTSSDGFSCDASLMVENEALKSKVEELTLALSKAYVGDARLLKCLGDQRSPINKEGLGYIPKKGKAAFVQAKPSFVKSNGHYCHRCKQVRHIEQDCQTKLILQRNKHVAYASQPKMNAKRNYAYMYHARPTHANRNVAHMPPKQNKNKNVAYNSHQLNVSNAPKKNNAYIPPHKRNIKLVACVPPPFFDASYKLFKGEKGVTAKFLGIPLKGTKKNAIWVPKDLVTNLQGPKLAWVHKKH